MVINCKLDLRDLLRERIDAMEDLNRDELLDCVDAFIMATSYMSMLESMNAKAKYSELKHDRCYKAHFYSCRETAQSYINVIDGLTLGDNGAE